ncbi:hypothetical protein [uncultured Bifidobacterium sp.]|uniref:type II secretion system F family protein n=1 Tax=uncultured Bifidobacterium sp. TaxID=165187 RepID=UPI00261B969B|nr:hypothetical protein [uncultured Bifidobacterium sp.]
MLIHLVVRRGVRRRLASLPLAVRVAGVVVPVEGDDVDGDEEVSRLVSMVRARVISGMPIARAMDVAAPLYAHARSSRDSSEFSRSTFSRSAIEGVLGSGGGSRLHDVGHVVRGFDAIIRVCSFSGTPMSPCLDALLRDVAERRAVRDGMESAFGVPRATARLLAVLPMLTIGPSELVGIHAVGFLLSGRAGLICLVVGLGMYTAGLLWIRVLLGSHALEATMPRWGHGRIRPARQCSGDLWTSS